MISIQKAKNLKGKKVIVRSDLNVPIENGGVRDGFRIDKALATILLLKKKGARVIVISHIGEGSDGSLSPVSLYLKKKKISHVFVPQVVGEGVVSAVEQMKDGDIVLLENLRKERGEKENDKHFARALASLADIYVNDAFPVSHRAHASIVSLPKMLPSFAGLQLLLEVQHLSLALKPKHPFIFILGGAKISTKMPILKRYLSHADGVFVGGAIVNNILRDLNYEIGKSAADDMKTPSSILKSKKLMLPCDVVVERGEQAVAVPLEEVAREDTIVDIGLATIEMMKPMLAKAKLVVWNGPMGYYEGGYDKATIGLLGILAKTKAATIVGGGDTVALISKMKIEKKLTFVSTGGGAALEYLAKGTLPGIKALK